jgi:heat-inducible transcriptional repressor
VAPRLDEVVLERIELAVVSSDKVLLVLTLRNGTIRTIYADVRASVPEKTLAAVTSVLNERLAGLRLIEIRASLPERLRDASPEDPMSQELLNIFVEASGDLLAPDTGAGDDVLLGYTSVVAAQPEFAQGEQQRGLIELTEQRDLLKQVLSARDHEATPRITIGREHRDPRLQPFTLITSEYRLGNLCGVLGVIGPTRMPYAKVAAIVEYASLLMGELSGDDVRTGPRLSDHHRP